MKTKEIEQVLKHMRKEGTLCTTGGSRSNVSYRHDGEHWQCIVFDEGYTSTHVTTREVVAEAIKTHPSRFLHILLAPIKARLRLAYIESKDAEALEQLAMLAQHGQNVDILSAILKWPEVTPDHATCATIRKEIQGHTMYHVFMDMMLWQETPPTGQLGLQFMDRLEQMVGVVTNGLAIKAKFAQMANQPQLAIQLYTLELKHHKPDTVEAQLIQRHLTTLKDIPS